MKLYRVNALMLKYWYICMNRIDRWFDIFYWPLLDIVLWGFMTTYIKNISEFNLLSALLGGIILWMFVWRGGQDISLFVLEDFWSRNIYNTFTTPVKEVEIVISTIIFGFFRSLMSFVAMALLAFVMHGFNILTLPWGILAAIVPILMLFGWATGIFIAGLIFRFGQRVQIFAWSFVWILQPFSCVFYPLASLPFWAQPIAKALPTTHVFEALRAGLNGTPVQWGWIAYAVIATLTAHVVLTMFLASSLKSAKKKGLLTRYD